MTAANYLGAKNSGLQCLTYSSCTYGRPVGAGPRFSRLEVPKYNWYTRQTGPFRLFCALLYMFVCNIRAHTSQGPPVPTTKQDLHILYLSPSFVPFYFFFFFFFSLFHHCLFFLCAEIVLGVSDNQLSWGNGNWLSPQLLKHIDPSRRKNSY